MSTTEVEAATESVQPELVEIESETEKLLLPDQPTSTEDSKVNFQMSVSQEPSNGDADIVEAISEVSIVGLESSKAEARKKLLSEIASLEFVDIPMLKDESTVDWISRNNVVVVMRGLPGSGKSTLVRSNRVEVMADVAVELFSWPTS